MSYPQVLRPPYPYDIPEPYSFIGITISTYVANKHFIGHLFVQHMEYLEQSQVHSQLGYPNRTLH